MANLPNKYYSATKKDEHEIAWMKLYRHYVEQKKSDRKENTLYDYIYTSSKTDNTNLW